MNREPVASRAAGAGTRIVSHDFDMEWWPADSARFHLSGPDGRKTVLLGTAGLTRMEGRTERGEPWRARRDDYSDPSLVDWSVP